MANKTMHHLVIEDNNYEILDAKNRANIAAEYSASSTYKVGDVVLYNGQLYKCTTAITTAEAWTAAHWTAVTVGGELTDLKDGLQDIEEEISHLDGLSEDVKQALLQIAEKVAYIDGHGQDYYDALEAALYPPVELVSISAVYTQSGTVLTTDTLDSLKADLIVTALYDDQSTETVTAYTLSGTLTEGTSTITVSYGGKSDTFDVIVTYSPLPSGYTELDYVHADNGAYLNTGYTPNANTSFEYKISLEALKASGHVASAVNYYAFGIRTSGYLVNRCGAEKSGSISYTVGTPIEVSMYMDNSDDIIIDGDVINTCAAGSSNPGVLSLFTYNSQTNYYVNSKLYYMRIYENGVLVKEYIPCMRDSDNKIGLYETVSGAFASSSNAYQEFTAS